MLRIYLKRFDELAQEMTALIESQETEYNSFLKKNQKSIDRNRLLEWRVKTKNLIRNACGKESEHYNAFLNHETEGSFTTSLEVLIKLQSVFKAAREDYEGGYLDSSQSLIQAEVFDSELEQATSLMENGYLSAASVVAGVVLETALRGMCEKRGLLIGKLDKMNADLAKAGAYNKLQQKRITALADIRNNAAHGHPENFTEADVKDMIRDVERFIAEHV